MNRVHSLVKSKDLGEWVQRGSWRMARAAAARQEASSVGFLRLQEADFFFLLCLDLPRKGLYWEAGWTRKHHPKSCALGTTWNRGGVRWARLSPTYGMSWEEEAHWTSSSKVRLMLEVMSKLCSSVSRRPLFLVLFGEVREKMTGQLLGWMLKTEWDRQVDLRRISPGLGPTEQTPRLRLQATIPVHPPFLET